MKAVVYKGPFEVAVEEVEKPGLQHPNDVIVRVTSTAICGSDLHMYEGRTAAEPGIVFGHENLGIIEETGDGVSSLRRGDRVVMPFNSEGTLSIHSIDTRRRESFYWAAVLATFALGTAAGDLTATIGFGYLGSAVLYAAAIAVPAVAHRWGGLNAVAAFWAAYVITRPLGASVADWMAVGHERGGLDLGLGPVTLSWAVAILGFVGYLAASRKDIRRDGVQ